MQRKDGQTYAPTSEIRQQVVEPNAFCFAAAYLDHPHIHGQCNGLTEAGATLKYVYDPDPKRVATFLEKFPGTVAVDSIEAILESDEIQLVASASIPSERAGIGLKVLESGKDYFVDKSPFTTLEQLETVRAKVEETGRKYMVYYAERVHTEAGMKAGQLIAEGAIGDVLQVLILAPHRLSKGSRPDWFWDKERFGGILTDIGSHQFEQFLTYTGAKEATINFARVDNFSSPEKPTFEDFGEASLTADTGASCYCRLDWFTPDGSPVWGDGRTFVMGTKGSIEVRKYWDPAQPGDPGQRIYLVDEKGTRLIECEGKIGYSFFGELILDCVNRTENAMTQEHAFKAAELSMKAQRLADQTRAAEALV